MTDRDPPAAGAPPELATVRARIDAIDEQLHALLNQRAELARLAGRSKQRSGSAAEMYRPER